MGLVTLGIGLGIQRLFCRKVAGFDDVLSACWIGWATTVVYLQFWHLLWPITVTTLVVPVGGGVVGLSLYVARERPRLPDPKPVYVAVFIVGVVWLAALTQVPIQPYDAGLYHLQTIKWINMYAVVPGLGNLHTRLAYNSALFLYEALANVGPLTDQAPRVANAFLLLLLLMQLTASAVSLIARKGQVPARDYLRSMLLVPALALVGRQGLATTSPDFAIWILEVVVSVELLDLLLAPKAVAWSLPVFRLALLTFVGVTVKLSFAAFALGVLVLVVWRSRQSLVEMSRVAMLAVVVLPPWVAHGIVLSGYALYPSVMFGAPVDWRMPAQTAQLDAAWVTGWARAPGPDALDSLGSWSWLGPWFLRNSLELGPALVLGLCSIALVILACRRFRLGFGSELLLAVPVTAGLVLWFLEAPDPRFAGALMWLLAIIPALRLRCVLNTRSRLTSLGVQTGAAVLLQLGSILGLVVLAVSSLTADPSWSTIPHPPLTQVTTAEGLVVSVPAQGDQAWDAPLPSAPQIPDGLAPRCLTNLACGFRIDQSA
jgi:hypothetical protein